MRDPLHEFGAVRVPEAELEAMLARAAEEGGARRDQRRELSRQGMCCSPRGRAGGWSPRAAAGSTVKA